MADQHVCMNHEESGDGEHMAHEVADDRTLRVVAGCIERGS